MEAFRRTLIMGNSGSGKSTLAQALGARTKAPAIDLDTIHWQGNGYRVKRDEQAARQMVLAVASESCWIIEGVYGWLAEVAVPRATDLIWLDMPWPICREALTSRGSRRGSGQAEFKALLAWAEAYWERQSPSSFAGHQRIFTSFAGKKNRLCSREDAIKLVDAWGSIKGTSC